MTIETVLYTQKELVQILDIDQSNVSRRLSVIDSVFSMIDNGHKVKAYPVTVLPEDMRKAVIAFEMAQEPETPLAMAKRMLPAPTTPMRDWQIEIRDSRILILNHIRGMVPICGGIMAAEKAFVEQAKKGELNPELAKVLQNALAKNRGGISYSALRGWRAALEKGGHDALAPRGGTEPSMPEWMTIFLEAYRVPGAPSIRRIYKRLTRDGVELPSLRTVQNWVKRMGKIESNITRLGMLQMKRYRVHSLRKTDTLLPTDVYTADGYSAKFYVQNPYNGRLLKPEIVTVIDVATRMVVGFAAGLAENRFNTLAALKDAVQKAGVPAIFYTDNGPGFKNKMLTDPVTGLMLNLGIDDHQSIPGRAWSRGLIERGQASIWSAHSRELQAYSDKESDRHQQRQLIKAIEKDLAECGQSDKLMDWTQFLNWAQNVIDEYNNTPHSGLPKVFCSRLNKVRHQTPAEYFRALAPKTEFLKPDINIIDNIMRPSVIRTPHNGWIRFENQQYFHRDLEGYHGMQVTAEYDPANINRLWIRNNRGELVCVAERDGNARDYFPKSVIERARDQRRNRQIALKQRQIADIEAEHRGQYVVEISPQKAAAILEFQESWENAKPQFVIPEDVCEKYELWQELNARTDILTEREQEFLEQYPKSSSFAVGKKRAADIEDFMRRVS